MARGPDRVTMDVSAAAAMLGLSRSAVYEAIRRGEVKSVRIGRRVVIPRLEIDRLLGRDDHSS